MPHLQNKNKIQNMYHQQKIVMARRILNYHESNIYRMTIHLSSPGAREGEARPHRERAREHPLYAFLGRSLPSQTLSSTGFAESCSECVISCPVGLGLGSSGLTVSTGPAADGFPWSTSPAADRFPWSRSVSSTSCLI